MSTDGILAMRADREEALALAASLTDEEWRAESACDGWSVQDVYAHMASYHHLTPASLQAGRAALADGIERVNDALVEVRRTWTSAAQVAEFERWTARGIGLLSVMQRPPLRYLRVPMLDLGTHRVADLADALAFDTYTHLRFDVLGPHGPVDREPLPEDPLRLRPVIGWLLAIFPPLHRSTLDFLDGGVHLALHGPGGGDWTIEPVSGTSGGVTLRPGRRGRPLAGISTTSAEFVGWSTRRVPWSSADVELDGDTDVAARVADAVNLF